MTCHNGNCRCATPNNPPTYNQDVLGNLIRVLLDTKAPDGDWTYVSMKPPPEANWCISVKALKEDAYWIGGQKYVRQPADPVAAKAPATAAPAAAAIPPAPEPVDPANQVRLELLENELAVLVNPKTTLSEKVGGICMKFGGSMFAQDLQDNIRVLNRAGISVGTSDFQFMINRSINAYKAEIALLKAQG